MSEEMSDTIRSAIHKSGRSLPTIAKKTGVAVSALSEFMDGADLHLTSASKIAAYLGPELKPSVQRKRVTMRPVKVIPPRKV
jgi:lambda repressor-like predicted transcriptional regulator